MKKMYGVLAVCAMLAVAPAVQAGIADFENLYLTNDSAWTGNGNGPSTNTFQSGGVTFYNNDLIPNVYWEGFAYSNIQDRTPSWLSSYPGGGYQSSNYAVVNTATAATDLLSVFFTVYDPAQATFAPQLVQGFNVANTKLTYDAVKAFDKFSIEDSVSLNVYGLGSDGSRTQESPVTFDLASFQNGTLNIVKTWDWVDLTSLGSVYGLQFELHSTIDSLFGKVVELGDYAPQTFAMDNLTVGDAAPVPVPAAAWLLGVGLVGLVGIRRRSER